VSPLQFGRRVDALAQFRVADPETPVLSDDDRHHLFRVLRARDGDELVVTNGAGAWSFTRVVGGELERVSDVEHDPHEDDVTLYLAPLKGDRSEWAVAKATELGVSTIVPLCAARVVAATRTGQLESAVAKWRRVAAAVAGQCRRTYDIVVTNPVAVSDVPAEVAVCDFAGSGSLDGVRAIAIGPEGGWAPDEWSAERVRLGLGGTVLRGDTAAVAAATLLVQARDGWARRSAATGVGNDGTDR
jgi:16S rRNA (uracil1498-N3)-methyltransferase